MQFLAALAQEVAINLRAVAPAFKVEHPGATGFDVTDPIDGLTFAVALRERSPGERVLSVCVIPPDMRPMDPMAGLLRDCPAPFATASARPDLAADWVAYAILPVRDTALRAIAAAQRRLAAERLERQRLQEEERARQARAEAERARAWAAAVEEERRAAEVRARADADRIRAENVARALLRDAMLGRLSEALESDFLTAHQVLLADPSRDLLRAGEFEDLRTAFVQKWAERGAVPLDGDQAAAVGAVGSDAKVIARAGSGKTRTLTTRAIFLQQHCHVSPREMLLVAFNRDAAKVMRERLEASLGSDIPHVMTFHALAHALVHPGEDLLRDDEAAGDLGLSREIQEVIDEHVRSAEHQPLIRDLMLAHFRDDWERIVDGRFELPIDELLAYRRALPRETLRGEPVKSFGERLIANTLFEHGVNYKYERNFRWDGENYRPDFTIMTGPDGGVVIEYFGLAGDADYDERSEAKRHFWAKRGSWTLLEYVPVDLARHGVDAFRACLVDDLHRVGIATRLRSEEEIWQEIHRRAIDKFTKAMANFVGRARRLDLDPSTLAARIEAHQPIGPTEALFLRIGLSIYGGYLARLQGHGQDDFDGLMWRAGRKVRAGETRFTRDRGREQGDLASLRFILVDEFQDFSAMFYELLAAVRAANRSVEFMCVGDDWQAINGWAGADLTYFENFEKWFEGGSEHSITTNYRSASAIVDAGNAVMHGHGLPARAKPRADGGRVWQCHLDQFEPTQIEMDRHERDELTPAVLRLVRRLLDEGRSVVLLARRNHVSGYVHYTDREARSVDGLGRFLSHLHAFLPDQDEKRVTIATTHKYKGREKDAVIVLDATEGAYPLIHPNWSFLRVFGDRLESIVDAERRLFYVALTRAENVLVLLTDSRRRSPFLDDVRIRVPLETVAWADLRPAPSLDGARVEVRVEGYNVKDALKALGYRYEGRLQAWCRTFMQDEFQLETLLGQSWSEGCDRILVVDESGSVIQRWSPEMRGTARG